MKKCTLIIGPISIVLIAFFIAGIALAKPISSRINHPQLETDPQFETIPVCVNFYQDSSDTSWAVVVQQITADNSSGFGACTPGEYVRWKVGITKGPDGEDLSTTLIYECFDQNSRPTCNIDGHRNPKNYFDEIRPAIGEPPAIILTAFSVVGISLTKPLRSILKLLR